MIRRARPDDAQAIAGVHVASWIETYQGLVPDSYLRNLSVAARQAMWSSAIESRRSIWVVEKEGRAIGFANGGKNSDGNSVYPGELHTLYLLRLFHRQGLGRLLFEKVHDELRKLGLFPFVIRVMKGNPALDFYMAMGARPITEGEKEFDGLKLREIELLCEA
jgi:GNAT superfamily N-acetyltransferase